MLIIEKFINFFKVTHQKIKGVSSTIINNLYEYKYRYKYIQFLWQQENVNSNCKRKTIL